MEKIIRTILMLKFLPQPQVGHSPGLQHIAFTVDDIDGTLEKLAKHGIEPLVSYSMTIDGAGNKKLEIHEAYLDSDRVGGTTIQLMEIRKK